MYIDDQRSAEGLEDVAVIGSVSDIAIRFPNGVARFAIERDDVLKIKTVLVKYQQVLVKDR